MMEVQICLGARPVDELQYSTTSRKGAAALRWFHETRDGDRPTAEVDHVTSSLAHQPTKGIVRYLRNADADVQYRILMLRDRPSQPFTALSTPSRPSADATRPASTEEDENRVSPPAENGTRRTVPAGLPPRARGDATFTGVQRTVAVDHPKPRVGSRARLVGREQQG